MASYVPPVKNGANGWIGYVSLAPRTPNGQWQSNPTLASGDVKVSIDGGALANLSTLPAVTPASSKLVKITLSQAEVNGDNITIIFSDAAGSEWCDLTINLQTVARQIDDLAFPNTSGRGMDVSAGGEVDANVTQFGGSNGTFSGGRPEVNTTLIEGSDATNQIRDAIVDDATRIDASALNTASGTTIPAIVADTNELQTDWANGGRLDLIVDAILDDTDLIDDGTSGLAKIATDVAAILVDTSTTLQDELDGIQADTEDIQSRLPAALTGDGNMKVDVLKIEGADPTDTIRDSVVDDATRIDASALNTLSSHDPGEAIMGATDLGTGSGLTSLATAAELAKVPKSDGTATWNATALAAIQSEANDALVAYDPPTKAELDSAVSPLATSAHVQEVEDKIDIIDTNVDSVLADTNELQTDWVNGGRLDLLLDATLADTNELQTDWANGGRLDLILDARASQTSVDDLPTNAELSTALGTADDAVLAAIAALQNLSASGAATAVLTTQMTESYAANGVSPTLAQAIFAIHQHLMSFAISGTSKTVKKLDGSTEAFVETLDDDTSPTALTRVA